jgi:hypothetical protein
MASRFRKVQDDNQDISIELDILLSFIVSSDFCRYVRNIYNDDYVQNEFVKRTIQWCVDYYDKYDKAPRRDIRKIFDSEKKKLQREETELIEFLLAELSKVSEDESSTDYRYSVDQAQNYFQRRHIEVIKDELDRCLKSGRVDKAQEILLARNHDISITSSTNVEFIFDREAIEEAWQEEDVSSVFRFTGNLAPMNSLTGPLKRGWLMAYLAPPKRGKTMWMVETACQAMTYGCKVLFVSLEMNSSGIRKRFYSRFLKKSAEPWTPGEYNRNVIVDEEGKVRVRVPYIDCQHNQDSSCARVERQQLYERAFMVGSEESEDTYVPCTACANKLDSDFAMRLNTIYEEADQSGGYESDHRQLLAVGRHIGRYVRLITYPSFLGGIDDIQRDLQQLRTFYGYNPDVIVVDYADILKPPAGGREERHNLDRVWKTLKGLAEQEDCLVVTASQSNRSGASKKRLQDKDVAEDFRKIAHVDIFLGINQNKSEKEVGLKRINTIAHRHRDFSPSFECFVSEAPHIGQASTNSVIPPRRPDDEDDEEEGED